MAKKSNFATLVLVVATALALLDGVSGAFYVVGDSLGWVIPPGGAAVYANWSSQHSFLTGDTLVFNFLSGAHDVAVVTKDALDSCNSTSPISLLTIGPANFTLSSAGDHHFICTFGQHCLNGQKLSVTVSSSAPSPAPTATPPASPPTTSPSPSPSPSSAPTPTPSTATPPPPQSPGTSPSPSPSGTTSPPPPPATASLPSPPSETTLTPPPPPPSSAPVKAVATALTVLSFVFGLMF